MTTLAELRRQQRIKKETEVQLPVVQESVTPVIELTPTENLSTFLKSLSETKKKRKEELKEKSIEVLPKLGDFFSLLTETKKKVEQTETVVADSTVSEAPSQQVIEKKEEVLEIVNELKTTIETLEQKQGEIEQTIDDSEGDLKSQLEGLQKALKALEKKLDVEVAKLQKMSRSINVSSGGGGEVRFERLDDVALSSLQDGDVIVYDALTNSFKNVPAEELMGNPTYTKLIDDTGYPVMYIGEAIPGSSQSNPVWRIQRVLFDANGSVDSITYAGLGNFTEIWVNRTGLSYS